MPIIDIFTAGIRVCSAWPRNGIAHAAKKAVPDRVDESMHAQVAAVLPRLPDQRIGADLIDLMDDVKLAKPIVPRRLIRQGVQYAAMLPA